MWELYKYNSTINWKEINNFDFSRCKFRFSHHLMQISFTKLFRVFWSYAWLCILRKLSWVISSKSTQPWVTRNFSLTSMTHTRKLNTSQIDLASLIHLSHELDLVASLWRHKITKKHSFFLFNGPHFVQTTSRHVNCLWSLSFCSIEYHLCTLR